MCWLFHLVRYYKNTVRLLPVKELYNYIPNRDAPPIKNLSVERKQQILSIDYKNYVEADKKLLNSYLGKTVELKKIVEEFRYVLSSS